MKQKVISVLVALAFTSVLGAQQIKEIEFKNQAVVDILLALAEMSGQLDRARRDCYGHSFVLFQPD